MAAPPPFNPLYSPCVSLHPFRASIYLVPSLFLSLFLSLSLIFRVIGRSRSDDEFIGGSRAEWSCIWPTECFVRRANVENEAFIGGRRCDARHRTASSSTFPSLLSPSSSFHAFLFVSSFSHLFVANRQRWENYEPKFFFFFFFLRDSITIATVVQLQDGGSLSSFVFPVK